GNLKSGEYDIVVDEYQSKFFYLNYDLYLGGEGRTVLSVFVPSNVPDLPGAAIAGMKQQALAQRNAAWLQLESALGDVAALAASNGGNVDALYVILQVVLGAELAIQCPDCPDDLKSLVRSRPNVMKDALGLLTQATKKYNGTY